MTDQSDTEPYNLQAIKDIPAEILLEIEVNALFNFFLRSNQAGLATVIYHPPYASDVELFVKESCIGLGLISSVKDNDNLVYDTYKKLFRIARPLLLNNEQVRRIYAGTDFENLVFKDNEYLALENKISQLEQRLAQAKATRHALSIPQEKLFRFGYYLDKMVTTALSCCWRKTLSLFRSK